MHSEDTTDIKPAMSPRASSDSGRTQQAPVQMLKKTCAVANNSFSIDFLLERKLEAKSTLESKAVASSTAATSGDPAQQDLVPAITLDSDRKRSHARKVITGVGSSDDASKAYRILDLCTTATTQLAVPSASELSLRQAVPFSHHPLAIRPSAADALEFMCRSHQGVSPFLPLGFAPTALPAFCHPYFMANLPPWHLANSAMRGLGIGSASFPTHAIRHASTASKQKSKAHAAASMTAPRSSAGADATAATNTSTAEHAPSQSSASGRASGAKKYRCDICSKAFSRSNTLVTHKRIHTGEKPFRCEHCGRAFRQPGNLTRHRLTHTTVKPYICSQCGKAFNRASNLHTHMRTHTNYRPFLCPYCGKGFHQKIDMKIHSYTHTGERPFKCEVCQKGFTLASTLTTHKRTHSKVKPYSCPHCGKMFYQKNSLKSHLVASHPYADADRWHSSA